MKSKTRQVLKDIVATANQIRSYGFSEQVREDGFGLRLIRNPEPDTDGIIEFILPDSKERDATLLHFRRFDQHNESFSFHKLKKLSQDEELSQNYRERLLDIRKRYFDYLNGCPRGVTPGFFQTKPYPSRGDIMRVVINGGIAHSDKIKRARFEVWTRDSIRASILFQLFSRIVSHVIKLIYELAEATRQELLLDNEFNTR